MKAAICEKYGPPEVLFIKEVDKPIPQNKEVLIKLKASSVNAADCNVRGLTYIPAGLSVLAKLMLGFSKPKKNILGSVFAGVIESVGNEVKDFKAGDEVYGTGAELGAYAEYMCRPVTGAIAIKPDNISFEEAAAIPYGALTSLHFLRDMANIQKGQKVLVKGASGGVGVYAVQLAHYFGAEVTGVCSKENLDFVRSLGADNVIDYTETDFTKSGNKWDIIFDIVVKDTSFARYKNSLNPKGVYLAVAGGLNDMFQMIRTSIFGGKKVKFGGGTDSEKRENMDFLNKLIKSGQLKPVLDRVFDLNEIVEAHKYVEQGKKKGNIAVRI